MKNDKNKALSRRAPVFFLEETDSTSSELKRRAAGGAEHGTVVWAARQTAGRGRMGRNFLSPEGGVYLSYLLRYGKPDAAMLSVTALAAVAVNRVLKELCGISPKIKWPNDILLNGRKLCGILTEAVSSGEEISIIVGIGVNLNTEQIPEEIRDLACSVVSETGKRTQPEAFVSGLLSELDNLTADIPAAAERCLAEYRAACGTLGRRMTTGETAVRIEEDYSLILRREDGSEVKKYFGEILQ